MSWYQDPNVLVSMVMFFILGLYNARIRELKKQVAGLQRWRGEDVNPKNLDQYKRIQALEVATGIAGPPWQKIWCPACNGFGDEGHLDDCRNLP